ncbi:MAG: hypothetical protein WD002_09435 [Pseudomonadales bacterium]
MTFRRLIALLLLLGLPVVAQSADIPRTSAGKPDMNGIWQTMSEANWSLEMQPATHAPMLRDGPEGPLAAIDVLKLGAVIAVPPSPGFIKGGGSIPYSDAAQERRQELREDWVNQDPEVKCYMPGVPRATYMPYPFQIFQNPTSFFIAYQFAGAVRDIYLNDPGEAPVDSWMGWSHGTWEEDTFVVKVTAQVDGTWLDRTGTHHSAMMTVTERYSMMGPNHIQYEATIEDPDVLTGPFTIEMPLYRRVEPHLQLLEFKCVEFVEELIYGEFRRNPLERP